MFRQNELSIAIAAVLASASMGQVHAQDRSSTGQDDIEEVIVTGLRGSLKQSMETKRDAVAVVDAINAEDIGKFPDTNLAESLQRITGISIDRRNGEGATVTARGFGPQFNLVTLNGRTMPAADAFGNGQLDLGSFGPQGRSFNFANLASEAISALEVYKTGQADIPSGGIGAAVNIRTARPFDSDGMVINAGVKGLYDESAPFDNDITPEVSGIFSYANDDKTWGVGLSASYQKRHGGAVEFTVNDWTIRRWDPLDLPGAFNENTRIENAPEIGQLYGIADDARYAFSDVERERINAQAVFQFAPTDSMTFTLDYTFARNELKQDRGEQTMWAQQSGTFDHVIFDTNQEVATPIYVFEMTADNYGNKDFGYEQQRMEQKNQLDSIGLNFDWQVTDRLSLAFDGHHSEAKSKPNDPVTGGSATFFSFAGVPLCSGIGDEVGGPNCAGFVAQEYRFGSTLPVATRWFFPDRANAAARTNGVMNPAFDANHLGSQILRIWVQQQETELDQLRLDGAFEFDHGRFQFGVGNITQEVRNRSSQNQMNLGNWGASDAGTDLARSMASLLRPFNLVGMFDDFNPGAAPRNAWRGNATRLAQWALANGYTQWNDGSGTPDGVLRYNPIWGNDETVKEEVNSVYVQLALSGALGGLPVNFLVGLRYEDTDVKSTARIAIPSSVTWEANNDFSIPRSTDPNDVVPFSEKADYNNLMPNVYFDIGLTDTLKARAAYSKTIARAPIANLIAGATPTAPAGSTLLNPAARGGGSANNPGLIPYESINIDLSLEWYFSDTGYLSIGYWDKMVDNFVGNSIVPMSLYGLTDPTAGPDALAAAQFLESQGITPTDTTLFVATALLRNSTLDLASYNAAVSALEQTEALYDLVGEADDPLYIFNVNRPINQEKARIHGWEIGGQYFFGDTGFGILANYTLVKGDVGFDNAFDPLRDQFALLGLSDTANIVLMYEKYGFTARLAWNWRDEFLLQANQGNSRNPRFVEEYEQIDLSIAYDVNDNLTVAFEAINLTGEDIRWHGRSPRQAFRIEDQMPRYAIGARYKF